MLELNKMCLVFDAPYDFDAYCRYIEWDRPREKRFYEPRRKKLKLIADQLQRLADDELDMLGVSLPPGVGKSTIGIFFICWMAGRNPDKPILCGSHSNSFLRGVYDECTRILDPDGEYRWQDVFPGVPPAPGHSRCCGGGGTAHQVALGGDTDKNEVIANSDLLSF